MSNNDHSEIEWPWPEDDRLGRRTRVAQMYRDMLGDIAPAACAELDQALTAFGQRWITDPPEPDTEALMTTRDIADFSDVSESAVLNWVSRWRIPCRGRNDFGRKLYRWGDIRDRRKKSA